MTPDVSAFFDPETFTISYLVVDPHSAEAAVIDSVLDYDMISGRTSTKTADRLLQAIAEKGCQVRWILETHVHADHLSAAPYLREKLGARVGIGHHVSDVQEAFAKVFNLAAGDRPEKPYFDHTFVDGETFALGGLDVEVLHTPGHTPACISYKIGDAVFVGDTIFMPDYGSARCDFPGGDARQLYHSIRRLLTLPPQTRLFMCHDYSPGGREPAWETTVMEQLESNIHIHKGVSEEDFVSFRQERDATLSLPKLLVPSVQINMRGGEKPEPEDNGVSYVKVPLDLL
ncbi:MBL fold metallo-hydrolase [Rhodovibrionaceae bacterium A322]